MVLHCIEITWKFNDFADIYFVDLLTNKSYYWYTNSEKAFNEIHDGSIIEVTSYKDAGTWHYDGEEFTTLKNVRFKLIKDGR